MIRKRWWHRFTKPYIIGNGYLHRWTLFALPRTRSFRVYLHHFRAPDPDPHLHDHPKWFLSIGLRGWYEEETPEKTVLWRAPWIRWFPSKHIHSIRKVGKGTWTIVFCGPVSREWGFWMNGPDGKLSRWVPWRQYLDTYK